jgi:pyruvate-formate lyase-activating enzyme
MAAVALAGFLDADGSPPKGLVVTAVLPGGCQMACPFCIVNARGERSENPSFGPAHLSQFLLAARERVPLGAVGVVGDEVLQDVAWPYAQQFLSTGRMLAQPMALVTNGYELERFVPNLLEFPGLRVLVSVDGIGDDHDRIRRTPGAFARVTRGLQEAVKHQVLRKNLSIATTLLPRNLDRLADIVRFASDIGVPRMVFSPVINFARRQPPKVQAGLVENAVPRLLGLPESKNVSLNFSDEFNLLGKSAELMKAGGINVMTPRRPPALVRIDATGGIETVRTIMTGTSTHLRLPAGLQDMGETVDELLGNEFSNLHLAA